MSATFSTNHYSDHNSKMNSSRILQPFVFADKERYHFVGRMCATFYLAHLIQLPIPKLQIRIFTYNFYLLPQTQSDF